MAQNRIPYPVIGPYMDMSKPSNQVNQGKYGYLAGVDGRYTACLKKFYGMDLVKQLTSSSANLQNVSFFRHVAFQKGTTSTEYRGFVVRHGASIADQQVDLFYYDTVLEAWQTTQAIYAAGGTAITSTTRMDCTVSGKFLFVFVEGRTPQTIYYTSSLQVIDFGAGDFVTEDGMLAMTEGATTGDTTYHLNGQGAYRVAFRFYDSTRDLYSAMSPMLTVTLDETDDDEDYSTVINFPDNIAGFLYTGFAALFDTVEVFRTINLGDYDAFDGSILYKESEIAKVDNWDTDATEWNALTVTIGLLQDQSLVIQDQYLPEDAVMIAAPESGVCGTWGNLTMVGRDPATRNGVDTLWSDPETFAPEYLTSTNLHRANISDGRPLRYIVAGDSMFILHSRSIVFATKKDTTFKFERQHVGRGLTSAGAAHTIGNDIILATPLGICIVNGKTAAMQVFTSLDRLCFDTWQGSMDDLDSCFDAEMNASFFLNPNDNQIAVIWWSNKSVSLLDGANFAHCSSGADILGTENDKAYFITSTGRIVTPDLDASGTGTMLGIASDLTINGTATGTIGNLILVDTAATFDSTLVGALVYMVTGSNAGESALVTDNTSTTLGLAASLSNDISPSDQYVISPVPFKVRLWPIPQPGNAQTIPSRVQRTIMTGIALKVQNTDGFTGNINANWRIGAYRNGSDSLETGDDSTTEIAVDENPADSYGALTVDGVDVEPYIELLSAGVKFELTYIEVGTTITVSRNIN